MSSFPGDNKIRGELVSKGAQDVLKWVSNNPALLALSWNLRSIGVLWSG
jgi:hypothetical protein